MVSPSIESLIAAIRTEAERAELPLDAAVYERAGRDPCDPILFAGSLDSPVAFFGRDLGRDEVLLGEPLIGDAGARVRRVLYGAVFDRDPPNTDRHLADAVNRVLLTNMVPYKPAGNKPFSRPIQESFRPYISEFLTCHWHGKCVITLGDQAFKWFGCYARAGAVKELWNSPDRYESQMECMIDCRNPNHHLSRKITVMPLPHPSGLNVAYFKVFPELLERRLGECGMSAPRSTGHK